VHIEPLTIEVGLGLVGLLEGAQDSPLPRRISAIRRQLVIDLGYLLPPFASPITFRSAAANT
jgi:flagellar biosynthesis protein FlhA